MTERSVVVMSGSTRAASTNTAFARTAAAHPPAGATVTAWTALTGLPQFDPDLDRDPLPAPVAALRDLLAGADAVVLCTPEYAGALPGAFKNALDWTVGSTVFSDKPVAWIKVAADARRGEGAHAELGTVLGCAIAASAGDRGAVSVRPNPEVRHGGAADRLRTRVY